MQDQSTQNSLYDLAVIGGGINGAGIAVDAAGRGLSVALCEQHDFANGTSSKSSKLIHGGLRYLEYYEFNLVRKALQEREILLRKAPHIIKPLLFVMPYEKHMRPAWLIRLGLFLYDHLGKRKLLPASKKVKLKNHFGQPLKSSLTTGFTYADCYVDDARLVILNAIQAQQFGATLLPRTQCISAERFADHWSVNLKNSLTGAEHTIKARVLVNAGGPWVEEILHQHLHLQSANDMALVKGSHIVVPRLYDGEHAYILQNTDGRIIFVIPFQINYSLIGTTDVNFQGDPQTVNISAEEIDYLLEAVGQYFQRKMTHQDIVWEYSGVRPLKSNHAENLSAITRDYSLELNTADQKAPLLTIFGGKITTYRELAEQALILLKRFFPSMGKPWTATTALPGGDIPVKQFTDFVQQAQQQFAFLPNQLVERYVNNYGSLIFKLLENVKSLNDLGENFGADLYQREVEYLIQYEFAFTADDILWRRTKLGLTFPPANKAKLETIITEIRLSCYFVSSSCLRT